MNQPRISFRPLRPAVASDQPTSLDLLVTITSPPPPEDVQSKQRPPLNLALVIDRSGSMSGAKLSNARKAACFLAGELTARDRLAVVSFDDEIRVVVPSQPVRDPQPFIAAINTITSGGCTALFDGWLAGAMQVAEHLNPAALNRVLLLSDGQANDGLTDQDEIAEKVAGLGQRGVSTSAFGLGLDFDEDLMAAIATAGDGSMAHIESPQQLEDLYASELQGLATTIGRRVSLGIRAKHGAELVDVVNDLTLTDFGNHQLANLRQGQELNVAMRLQLPAWRANQEICSVRLAWDQPGADSRSSLVEQLVLPVKPAAEVNELESDQAVIEEFAVLKANRSRRQALEELDQDDYQAAESRLNMVHADLSCLKPSKRRDRELHLIKAKQALLKTDHNRARKGLRRESLRSSLDVWDAE